VSKVGQSLAKVPASLVYAACHAWLQRRAKVIEARQQEEVRKLMSKGWFRPKTEYQARKKLEAPSAWNNYQLIEIIDSVNAGEMKELQALAEVSTGTVWLTSGHAAILRDDILEIRRKNESLQANA
jgi:hypothetical protein